MLVSLPPVRLSIKVYPDVKYPFTPSIAAAATPLIPPPCSSYAAFMLPSFSLTVSDAAPKIFPKNPFTASSPFFTVSFIFDIVSDASIPIADRAPPTASKNPDAKPPINERIASNPFRMKFLKSSAAADAKSRAPEKSPRNSATTAFTTLVTNDVKLVSALIRGVSAESAPCIAPAKVAPRTVRTTAPTFSIIRIIGCTACHSSVSFCPSFCSAGCMLVHACCTAF